MARLSSEDYLQHISDDSARFRAVLADCDPAARVPSCPDWDAADLLWHLGEVQHFWATMLRQRPTGPDDYEHGPRPESYAGLLDYFDAGSAALFAELTGVDPAVETWTWADDHTAGFIYRRQAHEALIHRRDAELAAGAVTPFDPVLAADGVDEVLDVMYGGKPPWGTFTPSDRFVRVDCTDSGDRTWVQLGHFDGTSPEGTVLDTEDINVVADPGVEPAAVIGGPAGALDAWLWQRGDDSELTVTGDREVYDQFRVCVNHPIS